MAGGPGCVQKVFFAGIFSSQQCDVCVVSAGAAGTSGVAFFFLFFLFFPRVSTLPSVVVGRTLPAMYGDGDDTMIVDGVDACAVDAQGAGTARACCCDGRRGGRVRACPCAFLLTDQCFCNAAVAVQPSSWGQR